MRLDFLGTLLLVVTAACGGDDASDGGASDDGAAIDAGEPGDAGIGSDAGPSIDGGTGDTCGGLLGVRCDETHFCDWADDSCGGSDMPGTCRPRPGECGPQGPPVCGCDGQPYESACEAQTAGTDLAQISICRTATGP